jgi:hypothetical protein
VIVYAVVDDSLSLTSPLGEAVETFIRRGTPAVHREGSRRRSELAGHLRIDGGSEYKSKLGRLNDKREAVDGDDQDRVAAVGSRVAASLPDLPAKLHLTIRAAGGEDSAGLAHHGVDTRPDALATHTPVPEQHLASEEHQADCEADDVPRGRQEEEQHNRDEQEHAPTLGGSEGAAGHAELPCSSRDYLRIEERELDTGGLN